MKSSVPVRISARLPFRGTPTTLKMMTNIRSESRNIDAVIGSILPKRAAPTESSAVRSHSRAVLWRSSEPTEKTVVMTTKMSSIIGMKLGER